MNDPPCNMKEHSFQNPKYSKKPHKKKSLFTHKYGLFKRFKCFIPIIR